MTDFFTIGSTFIEAQMIDECVVYRDAQGVYDDTLNPTTGLLEKPTSDKEPIYTGKCLVKPVSTRDMYYDMGSTPLFRKMYDLMIPYDVDKIKLGDTVYFTTATYDATLETMEFRVVEYRHSTHSTYRRLRLEDVQQDYSGTNPTS